MAQEKPKAVLFDIGGVCVLSPLQGILDFERKNNIPEGWINYAIRYSSPNGYWQRLERGEIKMDSEFFKGFTADLHHKEAWKRFNIYLRKEKKRLKDIANPTQLGDHVSLKTEAAESEPTDQDRGTDTTDKDTRRPSLSKLAKDTTIGDPVSLESEDVVEPPSRSRATPSNERPIGVSSTASESSYPQMPEIDGESLFWTMMNASRALDPYIFPALERLQKQKPRPIIGALSNTVIFPPDHSWSQGKRESSSSPSAPHTSQFFFNPKEFFDVYVASAEVGMRKPTQNIYELAMKRLDEFSKKNRGEGVEANKVVFVDDIGENLKAARKMGMKTIKVQLGKTWRAVKELEKELGDGEHLMDDEIKRAKL